jgi:DNA-binding IclR family transcriptional regulator
MGVRAIAVKLGLPLGSLHRLLLDLAEEDVVARTQTGEWELAYKLLEITGVQLEQFNFPALVRPFTERIANKTRETVNVAVLSGFQAVSVDKVRGNEGMQLDFPIGSRGPLNCGGNGKAILAFLNEEVRERILELPLSYHTSFTITNPEMLREEIDRIRQRGYSIDDQEVVLGVYCVSVPVFNRNKQPMGAISVSGPSPKTAGAAIEPLVEMLNEACAYASRHLGYSGAFPPVDAAELAQPKSG